MRTLLMLLLALSLTGCSLFESSALDMLEATERLRLGRPLKTLVSRFAEGNKAPILVYSYGEAGKCLVAFVWATPEGAAREQEEVPCVPPEVEAPKERQVGAHWLVYGRVGAEGATEVTLKLADGRTLEAPVANGFYHLVHKEPVRPQSAELKVAK